MVMMRDAPTVSPVGPWQEARVVDIRVETARARTYRLALSQPVRHLAGQHFLVRLTAPDGYTAQRSYSVASPPDGGGEIEVTVERLADGEVSSYLHDELVVGDRLDVRGPIGGWFVWDGSTPALLIGGGSGVVPLMAMLRMARRDAPPVSVHLVVSVRSPDDVFYRDELAGSDVTVIYTRVAPSESTRAPGRLTTADLAPLIHSDATTFVCGSSRFADGATELLIDVGVDASTIRVERFGPTG
jgi:ferredoxin-NADP reductase